MPSSSLPRRSAVLVAFVGAVAVVYAALGYTRSNDDARDLRASLAAARVATCILGDLAGALPVTDDALEARVLASIRDSELAENRDGVEQEAAWPVRCAPYARALAPLESRKGDASKARAARELASALAKPGSDAAEWASPFLVWLREMRFSDRSLGGAMNVPRPPTGPGAQFSVDSLDPRARILPPGATLARLHFAAVPDETTAFVVDVEGAPLYCVYAQGAVACRALRPVGPSSETPQEVSDAGAAAFVPIGTREADDAGAAPGLVRNAAGDVVDVESGSPVVVDRSGGVYGASSSRGGFDLLTVDGVPPALAIVHAKGRGADVKTTRVPLRPRVEIGDPAYDSGLFWGYAVTRRSVWGRRGLRLRAQRVVDGVPEPDVDVGQVGEAPGVESAGEVSHLLGCRSLGADGATIALRVRGWDVDYFSFHHGDAWSPPVELQGGAGTLSCRGTEAVLVDRRGHVEDEVYRGTLTESRCTPAGCRTRAVDLGDVVGDAPGRAPERAADVSAAAVDDKLLVLYRAGETGGVRVRVAPIDALRTADETVFFDDRRDRRALRHESSLLDMAVRSVPGGALTLLVTTEGTFLYRIDAERRAAFVAVTRP